MERIHRVVSFLDPENVKIFTAMKQYGPRNLQDVARRSGVPRATVQDRVAKLERAGLLRTWIHPEYSKMGLVRAMVLLTPRTGRELLAREALLIPGYWLRLIRCMGECNGYYSTHGIPVEKRWDFEQYLNKLVALEIASDYRIFWLGEADSPLPNFQYYDVRDKAWRFEWSEWFKILTSEPQPVRPDAASSSPGNFDKKDLIILKELVKDSRIKLSQLTKLLGMSLPAVKYRFDHLVRRGFIRDYVIEVLPYAPEISDLYELRLDFKTLDGLNDGEGVLRTFPFVKTLSRLEGSASTSLRVYLPRGEMSNLFTFLSALTRAGVLAGFSHVLLDPMTIQTQTFAYKYYEDGLGWRYDNQQYFQELQNSISVFEKGDTSQVTFQHMPMATLQ